MFLRKNQLLQNIINSSTFGDLTGAVGEQMNKPKQQVLGSDWIGVSRFWVGFSCGWHPNGKAVPLSSALDFGCKAMQQIDTPCRVGTVTV